MAIVGQPGPPGGGVLLNFTAGRVTATTAPSQATNWLVPWGLSTNPATLRLPEWAIECPFAGTLRRLRVSRAATTADVTFAVEVNGVTVGTLLLPGGTGGSMAADLAFSVAVAKGDQVTVAITAATPDSSTAQIVSATMMLQ